MSILASSSSSSCEILFIIIMHIETTNIKARNYWWKYKYKDKDKERVTDRVNIYIIMQMEVTVANQLEICSFSSRVLSLEQVFEIWSLTMTFGQEVSLVKKVFLYKNVIEELHLLLKMQKHWSIIPMIVRQYQWLLSPSNYIHRPPWRGRNR